MLSLISPAKKLLAISKPFTGSMTEPVFITRTECLIRIMQTKSLSEIAHLMDLSSDLAKLNFDRYQHFYLHNPPQDVSYPALLLFQGDVYQGLQAKTWDQKDIDFAEHHLAILSGLYGLLKPMDGIQAYRLEMGVRLKNPEGEQLYNFWGELITQYLNKELDSHNNPVLVNLASTEYFKVVQQKQFKHPIVTINFYEQKNNEVKMIGVYAKKARGLMGRYIIKHRIDSLEQLKEFNEQGYCFNETSSSSTNLDFVREHSK